MSTPAPTPTDLAPEAIAALVEGRDGDPFARLGMHLDAAGQVRVRAFLPNAARVGVVIDAAGAARVLRWLTRIDDAGLFDGVLPGRRRAFRYRLRILPQGGGDAFDQEDPYRFGPLLGELERSLGVFDLIIKRSDLFARLVAPGLSESLKQSVIVENKPGAGGSIGADLVAKSPPDGRTLLVSDSAAWSVSPSLYPNLPYQAKDLLPVADVARFANVLLVSGQSPYRSLADVLEAARREPGKLTIASAGNGSSPHLTAEKFQREAGIRLTHVAYKGSGPAITDTIGGQVDMVFSGLPSVTEYLNSGRLRAIAIASAKRSPFVPDVPTLAESGVPGFESLISQGLFAPAGTPESMVVRLNAAIGQVMTSKEMAPRLQQLRVEAQAQSSAEYQDWLRGQAVTWSRLIKEASIRVE